MLACASCALFLPIGRRSLRKFESSSAYKQKAPLDAGPFFLCPEEDSNPSPLNILFQGSGPPPAADVRILRTFPPFRPAQPSEVRVFFC
jgi:hypothetical protein